MRRVTRGLSWGGCYYHDGGKLGNTVVYVKPKGTVECPAKIRVDMEIDGLGVRHEELTCCLWSPHPLYRHMNPRVQATIGGDRWTDSKEWSYYLEKVAPISIHRKKSHIWEVVENKDDHKVDGRTEYCNLCDQFRELIDGKWQIRKKW